MNISNNQFKNIMA